MRPQAISVCKYSDDYSYIVALSESPYYGIMVFSASTGALYKSYYEKDTSTSATLSSRVPVGITMTAAGALYLVTNQNNQIYVSSFNVLAATFSLTYYRSHTNSATTFATCSVMTASRGNIYVGGQIGTDMLLLKVDATAGTSNF